MSDISRAIILSKTPVRFALTESGEPVRIIIRSLFLNGYSYTQVRNMARKHLNLTEEELDRIIKIYSLRELS